MIGKIQTGKTFRGCIEYCLSDKKINGKKLNSSGRATVLYYNLCYGNKRELIRDFNNVAALNPKQSRPVFHLTLSLAKGETLEKDKWLTVAEQAAQRFGFENNQYLLISHNDTDSHEHVHIVANRISFEGKTTVSDSNSYKKVADLCRKIEQDLHLQAVLNPRRYLPRKKRSIPRSDERKNRLIKLVKASLENTTVNS